MDIAEPLPVAADLPSPADLARGLAGYVLLGLVGGLTGDDPVAAAPAAAVTAGGMLLLTVPALLVAHQYLRLSAAPASLLGELARTFVRCGELALGALPVVLLFAATSALGGPVATLVLAGLAGMGFTLATRRLVRAEARADGSAWRMSVLAVGWCALAAMVGLRIFLPFSAHLS